MSETRFRIAVSGLHSNWRKGMLKNYFKIAVRNILRNKLYSFINIAGLSVGIAIAIVILLFVQNELTFDTFNKNKDRIYRAIIHERRSGEDHPCAVGPLPLGPALVSEFPEIKSAVRIFSGLGAISHGSDTYSEIIKFTDPSVFTVFSYPLVQGNPATALAQPNSVVLTQREARKIFGDENPLSQPLKIKLGGKTGEYLVTGVAKDVPDNSSIEFNVLMPLTNWTYFGTEQNDWGNFSGSTFILLSKSAKISDVQRGIGTFIEKYFGGLISSWQTNGWLESSSKAFGIRFEPLLRVHFSSVTFSDERRGDPVYFHVLSIIAFIIVSIACINFITLSLGKSTSRTKEVGVRKVLGAGRTHIAKQFWGESIILIAASFLLSIFIVELLLPLFDRLFERHYSLGSIISPSFLLVLAGLIMLVGILAGAYPSILLSKFQPAEVLKGKQIVGKGSLFSKWLVVLQFGLAIFLIIASLVVWRQLNYVETKNLGYNGDQVIVVPVDWDKGSQEIDLFKNELSGHSGIIEITGANATFGSGSSVKLFGYNGRTHETYLYRVDQDYIRTLGLDLVEGRNFRTGSSTDSTESVIVNEAFMKDLGWKMPAVGNQIPSWRWNLNESVTLRIIGVVRDYNFLSLHDSIGPVMLTMDPDWGESAMMIKISKTDIPATVSYIKKVYGKILPDKWFDFSFLDRNVQKQYDNDRKWGEIVGMSSLLAIVISCLGLFGLTTLAVALRTKEVGIRKVLGASVDSIFTLLSKDSLKLVLIANVVAWPVGWYAAHKWLQSFAYSTNLSPWIFLLAAGLAIAISLLTIFSRTIRAATANPVEALRYE